MSQDTGEGPLGILKGAAVGFSGGEVCYIGPAQNAPGAPRILSAKGCVGLPGLVDCHTHTLFAGSRAEEFSKRLAGASYSEILEGGGGILSTVAATRAAGNAELSALLSARLQGFLACGVTTVEVKTGYGLSADHEIRMLSLLKQGSWPTQVVPTFLGAHALPPEFQGDRAGYVDCVIEQMLPLAAGLAESVDVYCDRGAFTLEEAERILRAGIGHGLQGRIHAEQVEYTGSAAMAAGLGCRSADHLERIDAAGIDALAQAGTVGVMLPGAMMYLRDESPPVGALLEAGVSLAVATDFNPGSSPVRDLLACATLSCLIMGLSVEQALLGITRHAGQALGRGELGWLGTGSAADLVLIAPPPGEPVRSDSLVQYLGGHRACVVVRKGAVVLDTDNRLGS